ncbi:MAG: hypothetical protein ACOY0T_18220 [Myxococcota bacterium]
MKVGYQLAFARFARFAPFALLCMAACSSDGDGSTGSVDSTTIASTPLSGKADGKPWTFVNGWTDAFLSEGEPNYWAALYAESLTSCSGIPDNKQPELLMNLPRQPGTYKLSLQLNATFAIARASNDTDNLVATKGKLVIDEVTATQVRGGAFVEYDANNSVNGQFQIAVCPD